MNEPKKGLSREFVLRSILGLLDKAEKGKEWGSITVIYQAGNCKTIKK
jgi:hypothetical protein